VNLTHRILALLLAGLPGLLPGALDHVIISEIVLVPTEGEYIKLENPTSQAIDLSDYYITDATDTGGGNYYYNLPSGSNYWSGSGTDFIVRFPAGFTIDAGGEVVLAIGSDSDYQGQYGSQPDLSLKDDMLPAVTGETTVGAADFFLANDEETLVLFTWDGSASTVRDVDYLLWGGTTYAVDKSGVSGYASDTPVAQQEFMPNHVGGEKLQRVGGEGTEAQSGGNGVTGHDETSENLSGTWQVVSVGNTKPAISNIALTPADPKVGDSLTVSAQVTDDGSVASVELVYSFDSGTNQTKSMPLITGSTYRTGISPFQSAGTLNYYIRAADDTGLRDSSSIRSVEIAEAPQELTIAEIVENMAEYDGEIVTIDGVVTAPAGKLRTTFTEGFLQDESGKGIILYNASLDTSFHRGDSVEVTGEIDEFDGKPELIYSSITVLKQNAALPVVELNIEEFNSLEYNYTFVSLWGKITARQDLSGPGSNITIEDPTGANTIVRIWNSTEILYDENENLVNHTMDSLLQVGNLIDVSGIGSEYSGQSQIQPIFPSDISEHQEGEVGNYQAKLNVAPYPFVPQLGEQIKFDFSFPANSRIKLRIYDTSGRYVTSLYDEYRGLSFYIESAWDGRNEVNELVPPGVYIMHLEVTDINTGDLSTDTAPVVIGVYGK